MIDDRSSMIDGRSVLPIEATLPALRTALAEARRAVLVAPPGAGKTTRVPLALLDAPWLGARRIVMLEPRRLATRAAATYMASILGERVGQLIRTGIEEYVSFPNGYALALLDPPKWAVGLTVEEVGIKGKYGVAVIGLQEPDGVVEFPHPSHRIRKDERLAVAGPTDAVDAFSLASPQG